MNQRNRELHIAPWSPIERDAKAMADPASMPPWSALLECRPRSPPPPPPPPPQYYPRLDPHRYRCDCRHFTSSGPPSPPASGGYSGENGGKATGRPEEGSHQLPPPPLAGSAPPASTIPVPLQIAAQY
ncbi:hypothetical protein OsJ_34651 [Oryza sativa Japonica Group]|uniref:Uncharacterized protein n=1 Tax=Oryza sativa subsp. japonica TaxID=39947 RepID=B9G8L3_ORYSJ|nr:hypothetical protein OsJ_34651 [Oryza sativa Japonica Group]